MTRRLGVIAVLAAVVAGLLAAPMPTWSGGANHMMLEGTGVTSAGEPMRVACELAFAAVPSNEFLGECWIGVGGDELTLTPLAEDGRAVLTAVLNGSIIVRGGAGVGTGRFLELMLGSAAGFPVDLEIDPLARTWAVRGHGPGEGGGVVVSGLLVGGGATLTLP